MAACARFDRRDVAALQVLSGPGQLRLSARTNSERVASGASSGRGRQTRTIEKPKNCDGLAEPTRLFGGARPGSGKKGQTNKPFQHTFPPVTTY